METAKTDETLQSEEVSAAFAELARKEKLAWALTIFFVYACLLTNVIWFCLHCKIWNFQTEKLSTLPAFGAELDLFILLLFTFNLAPFNFLRMKSFAFAGAFCYLAYSANGGFDLPAVAAFSLTGLLTIRFPPLFTFLLGVCAFSATIYWNLIN